MDIFILIIGRYLMYLVIVILIWGLFIPSCRRTAFTALMSAAFAAGVSWMIKEFFYLPRPFVISGTSPVLPYLLDGSLPSSHTAVAFSVATVIFFSHRRLGLVFLALALLIATGRILGGVHSYLDVILGSLLGIFLAWWLTTVTHNARLLK